MKLNSALRIPHSAFGRASSRRLLLRAVLALLNASISGSVSTQAQTPGTGQSFSVLHSFANSDGASPCGGLVVSAGTLYGAAQNGGSANAGVVFSLGTNGAGYKVLHDFTGGNDGGTPQAGVIESAGALYGTTYSGGTGVDGTVFRVNTDGRSFAVLHNFNAFSTNDGANPSAPLLLLGGVLYGTSLYSTVPYTNSGGVFALNPDGTAFRLLHAFDISDGSDLESPLVPVNGLLCSTAPAGGPFGDGEVFTVSGDSFNIVHPFHFTDGQGPSGGILAAADGGLYGVTDYGGTAGGTLYCLSSQNWSVAVRYNFPGTSPAGPLVISGRTLYGTTYFGGTYNQGAVFAINTDGTGFTNLYSFTGGADGSRPNGGLLLFNGALYGTTTRGGAGYGVVFRVQLNPVLVPVQLLDPQRSGTNFTFSFLTIAGQSYSVQHNDDLRTANWVVDTNLIAAGPVVQFSSPMAGVPHRFFRVSQP